MKKKFYICSHPRSGRHWTLHLFGCYVELLFGHKFTRESLPKFADCFTKQIGDSRGPLGVAGLPEIWRTHTTPLAHDFSDGHIIFIYRNPYDTVASWWRYLGDGTSYQSYTETWIDYMNSFATYLDGATVLVYEKFIADAGSELTKMLKVFGLPVKGKFLKKAVSMASIEEMKKIEGKLIRIGGVGGGVKDIPEDELQKVKKTLLEELRPQVLDHFGRQIRHMA